MKLQITVGFGATVPGWVVPAGTGLGVVRTTGFAFVADVVDVAVSVVVVDICDDVDDMFGFMPRK